MGREGIRGWSPVCGLWSDFSFCPNTVLGSNQNTPMWTNPVEKWVAFTKIAKEEG